MRVGNGDGRERGPGLSGELVIEPHGARRSLRANVESDGSPRAVLADATSGNGGHRFRFPRLADPAGDGPVTVDFDRSLLPPCAFAAHFVRPLRPPARRSPWRSRRGGRNLIAR